MSGNRQSSFFYTSKSYGFGSWLLPADCNFFIYKSLQLSNFSHTSLHDKKCKHGKGLYISFELNKLVTNDGRCLGTENVHLINC